MIEPKLYLLLVDDSDLQIEFAVSLLANESIEVIVARNGVEALDKARDHQPDIILLDIVMPVMDGIQAAERIRLDPLTSTIPIIMVTSQSDEDYMENAFVGGCNDYVTKPVRRSELIAKISSLTGYQPRRVMP